MQAVVGLPNCRHLSSINQYGSCLTALVLTDIILIVHISFKASIYMNGHSFALSLSILVGRRPTISLLSSSSVSTARTASGYFSQ